MKESRCNLKKTQKSNWKISLQTKFFIHVNAHLTADPQSEDKRAISARKTNARGQASERP